MAVEFLIGSSFSVCFKSNRHKVNGFVYVANVTTKLYKQVYINMFKYQIMFNYDNKLTCTVDFCNSCLKHCSILVIDCLLAMQLVILPKNRFFFCYCWV